MNGLIGPGDLVVVVRDCCGHWLGQTFTVERVHIVFWPNTGDCPHCGFVKHGTFYAVDSADKSACNDGKMAFAPRDWVKKIPPLAELEDIHETDEVLA